MWNPHTYWYVPGFSKVTESDAPFPSACSDTICPGPSPLLTFAAQLIPGTPQAGSPIGQNLALTEVLPLVFASSNGQAELRMRNPAVVKGTVEDAAGAPVPRARVTISLPSLIPGQSPTTQSATTDVRGEFSLAVPAAQDASKQTHRIWVSFDDPAQAREHPPLARAQQISNDVDLQLRLQQEATLSIVRGRVLDAQLRALPGARVQVQTASGDILSSTDISDEAGGYRLLLDQTLTTEDQVFLVAQPPQGGQAPVLLRRLKRPNGPADLVDINLQQPAYLPPQMVKLQLRGTGPSGPLDAVGARVQAQVQLGDDGALDVMGLGIYNASGDTDKDGAVTLPLLVLGFLVLQRGWRTLAKVTAATMLVGGLGVWIFGAAGSVHLGASVLVFGYLGYLLSRGVFERRFWSVLGGVVVVLAVGAQEVLSGTTSRGELSQFVIFALLGATSLSQLSEIWNEISAGAGAAVRVECHGNLDHGGGGDGSTLLGAAPAVDGTL